MPEITEDWKKLKRDAMSAFCLAGLLANPSLTYLKTNEIVEKAILTADTLQKSLDLEATPTEDV